MSEKDRKPGDHRPSKEQANVPPPDRKGGMIHDHGRKEPERRNEERKTTDWNKPNPPPKK